MDSDVDSDNVFALNGCYDPDITGIGHQPRYFDQFMGLYVRYRVLRAAVRMTYVPLSTGAAGGVLMSLWPTLVATTLEGTSLQNLLDNPNLISRVANGTGSQFAPSVQTEIDIEALSETDRYATTLYGSSSSNPTYPVYVHVFLATMDITSLLAGQLLVEIMYYTEFSRRNEVSAS